MCCLIAVTGGYNSDTFAIALNQGLDTITDFAIGEDLLELLDGLSFGQLFKVQQKKDTLLSFENQTFALLKDVMVDSLTVDSFVPMSEYA